MTAEIVHYTREQLLQRKQELLQRVGGDAAELQQRAENHVMTPDDRDLLLELEEVDFLLGENA